MDHDQSYKLLFSHPEMVADLLRGFVHEDWVQHLDFDSLEKVSGTYVADDLREREDDVIWKGSRVRIRSNGQVVAHTHHPDHRLPTRYFESGVFHLRRFPVDPLVHVSFTVATPLATSEIPTPASSLTGQLR